MICYGAVLRRNLFLVEKGHTNMFTYSYIQVSDTFTIIGILAESLPKLINDTRSNLEVRSLSILVNCHNSRTKNDIDIKLGQVTKLDKRNKTAAKKLMITSCWQIVTSFSQFMANLEQSGSQIPDG